MSNMFKVQFMVNLNTNWISIRLYENTGVYYYEIQFYNYNNLHIAFTKVRISDLNVTTLWTL